MSVNKIMPHILIALAVLFIAFALSSGVISNIYSQLSDKMMPVIQPLLNHHIRSLEVDAKHYFLFPEGGYTIELHTQPLSFTKLMYILFNSIFNILFQPVFLCPFTPQVILNIAILPFFLYGAITKFRKVWFMIAVFIVIAFRVGIYDLGVEPLLRHGMSCELIYLLIGLAGFTGWITKNS